MNRDSVDLKPLIELALDDARDSVLAGQDCLRQFFVADAQGRLNMVCAPAEGEESERLVLRWLRTMFAAWGATQYAMVSEVWTSQGTRYSRAAGSQPMDDPNRGEALSAIAVRRIRGESGASSVIKAYATRLITRNPTRVGEIVWPQFDDLSGRFTMLLPPEDVPPLPPAVQELVLRALPAFKHRTGRLQ